jgi:transcriptional regulator with XRE-family HTH domain
MKFGHAIKQQRLLKGRTVEEVSIFVGVGKPYISQIENLRTIPSPETVVSICKYLALYPKDYLKMVAYEKITASKLDIMYRYITATGTCPHDIRCVHWDYGCYYSSECVHEKLEIVQ